jgi:hypothetical protein
MYSRLEGVHPPLFSSRLERFLWRLADGLRERNLKEKVHNVGVHTIRCLSALLATVFVIKECMKNIIQLRIRGVS